MSAKKVISFRLSDDVIQKLNEKCPNISKSLIINNLFEYILSQNDELILEFCKKNHS